MSPATAAAPPGARARRPSRLHWLLAFALALACLVATSAGLRPQTLRAYDQPIYLGVAADLAGTGVYTNGRRAADPREPGAYTAPLYPALVALVMRASPELARNAACVRWATDEGIAGCPTGLGLLRPVQTVLAALTLVLVWRSALAVSGNAVAAWCALLAAGLLTSEYAAYARTAMTEALSLPLAALFGLWLVFLVQRRRTAWAAGAGAVLGLLCLTRPEYVAVAGGLLACGALAWGLGALRRRAEAAQLGRLLLGAGAVAAAVTLPWLARNRLLFGEAQITVSYSGFILAQRVAYQAMTWREWLASWPYALPGFGPALARHLLPAADTLRLGWEERPDTFYMQGPVLVNLMRLAVPDPAGQVPWLLRTRILPDLPWFAAVTLVMAWKGLWVRKYFSLVTVPFFFWLTGRALLRRDAALIALIAPPLLVLLVHAAATVSTPRYSLMLIPCYATAFGMALAPLLTTAARRLAPHAARRATRETPTA